MTASDGRFEVDPDALIRNGRELGSLGTQLGMLSDSLGAALSGGIASGLDPAGLNFGLTYADLAQNFADYLADAANALKSQGYMLEATGFNYKNADAASTVGGPGPAGGVGEVPATTAAADAPLGPNGTFVPPPPGWAIVEALVGLPWPSGVPALMSLNAAQWKNYVNGFVAVQASVDRAKASVALDVQHLAEGPKINEALQTLGDKVSHLAKLAKETATKIEEFAKGVQEAQDAIRRILDRMSLSGVIDTVKGIFTGDGARIVREIAHDARAVLNYLQSIVKAIVGVLGQLIEEIGDAATALQEWVKPRLEQVFGEEVGGALFTAFKTYTDFQVGVVSGVIGTVAGVVAMADPDTWIGMYDVAMMVVQDPSKADDVLVAMGKEFVAWDKWSGDHPGRAAGEAGFNILSSFAPGGPLSKAGLAAKGMRAAKGAMAADGKLSKLGDLTRLGSGKGKLEGLDSPGPSKAPELPEFAPTPGIPESVIGSKGPNDFGAPVSRPGPDGHVGSPESSAPRGSHGGGGDDPPDPPGRATGPSESVPAHSSGPSPQSPSSTGPGHPVDSPHSPGSSTPNHSPSSGGPVTPSVTHAPESSGPAYTPDSSQSQSGNGQTPATHEPSAPESRQSADGASRPDHGSAPHSPDRAGDGQAPNANHGPNSGEHSGRADERANTPADQLPAQTPSAEHPASPERTATDGASPGEQSQPPGDSHTGRPDSGVTPAGMMPMVGGPIASHAPGPVHSPADSQGSSAKPQTSDPASRNSDAKTPHTTSPDNTRAQSPTVAGPAPGHAPSAPVHATAQPAAATAAGSTSDSRISATPRGGGESQQTSSHPSSTGTAERRVDAGDGTVPPRGLGDGKVDGSHDPDRRVPAPDVSDGTGTGPTTSRPDPADAVMPVLDRYGVTLDEFKAMQERAAQVGRGALGDHFTTDELRMMYEARMSHPHPGPNDLIQKVVSEPAVRSILDQVDNPGSQYGGGGPYKADAVGGCVSVASDAASLRTPKDLLRALRLDYGEWSPYEVFTTTDHAYVVEGRLAEGRISVPNGHVTEHLDIIDPRTHDLEDGAPPHTGTGYTGDRHGLNPEYQLERGKWQPGATLTRIDPDGSRHPVARLDDEDTWVTAKQSGDQVADCWPQHKGGEWVFPNSPQHGLHPDPPDPSPDPTHRGSEAGGDPARTGPPPTPAQDTATAAGAFHGSAFDTTGGAAFFDPADTAMRTAAGDTSSFPGEFTVDVHGDSDAVSLWDSSGTEHRLGAHEFADQIRNNTRWDGHSPIRLLSCDTGAGQHAFAADLARDLGVPVTAPDRPVWTFPDGRQPIVSGFERGVNGELTPRIPPDGGWNRFSPDGSMQRVPEQTGAHDSEARDDRVTTRGTGDAAHRGEQVDPPGNEGPLQAAGDRPEWVQQFVDGDLDAPIDPPGMRELWEHLDPDERIDLYRQDPMFGDDAQLPVTVCDEYARDALHHWRELMPDDPMYRSIEEAIRQRPDQPIRYLLGFDPDGRSITSVGNPDSASHTAVLVPGTFTDATKLVPSLEGPGYMEVAQRFQANADFMLGREGSAVVDWQNYHAPQSLGPSGAMRHGFAEDGALELRGFLDRLDHTNQIAEPHRTVIGHSYGAAVVGLAAQGADGLNAHALVTLGGAGMHARSVTDLVLQGIPLERGSAPVWALMHPNDPILAVQPFDRTPFAHGRMTHQEDFGAHIEWIDEKTGSWLANVDMAAHSAYWDLDSHSLMLIGQIIAGLRQ